MSRPTRVFPGRVVRRGFERLSDSQESRNDQRERGKRKDARRVLCGSTPEDTVSSGAIRDESRSSTRVPRPLPRGRTVVWVLLSSNPRDGASFFPVALFLSLIPFHSPMRRFLSLSFSLHLRPTLFLSLSIRSFTSTFVYPSLSYPAKLVAVDYTSTRLLPLYAFDAIMPQPLWRLVNSVVPPFSPLGKCDITEGIVTIEERNLTENFVDVFKFWHIFEILINVPYTNNVKYTKVYF